MYFPDHASSLHWFSLASKCWISHYLLCQYALRATIKYFFIYLTSAWEVERSALLKAFLPWMLKKILKHCTCCRQRYLSRADAELKLFCFGVFIQGRSILSQCLHTDIFHIFSFISQSWVYTWDCHNPQSNTWDCKIAFKIAFDCFFFFSGWH